MNTQFRVLTSRELELVSGAGPISTGADAAGGFLGAKLGASSGAEFGAELGGLLCAPAGPEASAVCALIGLGLGKKYGQVTGAVGGAILGKMIGDAIESFFSNFGKYLGQLDTVQGVVNGWFNDMGLDVQYGQDPGFNAAGMDVSSNLGIAGFDVNDINAVGDTEQTVSGT